MRRQKGGRREERRSDVACLLSQWRCEKFCYVGTQNMSVNSSLLVNIWFKKGGDAETAMRVSVSPLLFGVV